MTLKKTDGNKTEWSPKKRIEATFFNQPEERTEQYINNKLSLNNNA